MWGFPPKPQPLWAQQMEKRIMSTLADVQAAQAATDAKIATVKADVEALLAKVAAIPPAGLTPEQQAAIDDITAHATKINDSLGAVDGEVNPAPAAGT